MEETDHLDAGRPWLWQPLLLQEVVIRYNSLAKKTFLASFMSTELASVRLLCATAGRLVASTRTCKFSIHCATLCQYASQFDYIECEPSYVALLHSCFSNSLWLHGFLSSISARTDCDTCRWMDPATYGRVGDMSAVTRQPKTLEEREKAMQALLTCPT